MTSIEYTEFSPYRGTFQEEMEAFAEKSHDIYEAYSKEVCSSLQGRGVGFCICYALLMVCATVRVIRYAISRMQKPSFKSSVQKTPFYELKPAKEIHESMLMARESCDINKDVYQTNNKIKDAKSEKITKLRSYLYSNKMQLPVRVIKTIEHRVPEDVMIKYLQTGEIIKPFTTDYVTFGDEINELLKETLTTNIDLKKDKKTKETYISIPNMEIDLIISELSDMFMTEVKLKYID
jgi:hypothetical protein